MKRDSVSKLHGQHRMRVVQHRHDTHQTDDHLVAAKAGDVGVEASDRAIERRATRAKKRILVPARKLRGERAQVFAPGQLSLRAVSRLDGFAVACG